jgi:hypothetical protein
MNIRIITLKILIFILLSLNIYSQTVFNGLHQSEYELAQSDYENYNVSTFVPAKGSVNYYNNQLKFDGNLKYKFTTSTNSESDEDMSYSAFGGRWQYNGIKDATIGLKGALDYDYLFINKESYYTRIEREEYLPYSGNLQSESSFGIKFYANKYFHPAPKITTGFWNEYAVTKIEKNDYNKMIIYKNGNLESDTDNSYLTVTPRFLYVDELGSFKFVGEAYVDVRKYFTGMVDLNGDEKDYFYKTIVNPQFIYNKETKSQIAYVYANVENEKMMTIDYWQHVFKVAPRYEYRGIKKVKLGATGAGYEKQEEIGINFDNKELIAIKQSNTYRADVFAWKLYAEYSITDSWSIGNELINRNGKWKDGDNGAYLDEEHNITYLKYIYKYSEKGNIEVKNSYEIYRNSNDLDINKAPIEENMFRIKASWNYKI